MGGAPGRFSLVCLWYGGHTGVGRNGVSDLGCRRRQYEAVPMAGPLLRGCGVEDTPRWVETELG